MELYNDRGIIRLYDGTVVYVIDIQYSADGVTKWESTYNANPHVYEGDGVTPVGGHRYMRIKHSGDTAYQKPMYITAVDGKSPEIKVEGGYIYWGYADVADSWSVIASLEDLKGETGDQGPRGEGLQVTGYGWYGEFNLSRPTTGCLTCNRTGATINTPVTMYSFGDGQLPITATNISNGDYRSTDGITWVAIGANDLGRLTRFVADDGIGTNYIDYRQTDTLATKGSVYAFVEETSTWEELTNLATPTYQVAATSGNPTNGKFLGDYASSTIGLDLDENLEVIDGSLTVAKADASFAGHGLDKGATLEVNPDELVGHGLSVYVATSDSKKHVEVAIDELVSNGLSYEAGAVVDGEDHYKAYVKPADLINSTSGLEVATQLDGYDDLKVKSGDAITVDADGVNVKADETSLTSDGLAAIKVYPTDNNNKGIQALHLHSNTANPNKGLQKGATVLDPLEVKVDAATLGFDGSGNVFVNDHGITGVKLNSNTVDATKGLLYSSDKISVNLKTGGGLSFDTGQLQVDSVSLLNNKAVTSIEGLQNAVTMSVDNTLSAGTGLTLTKAIVAPNVAVGLSVDIPTLQGALGIIGGAYAPAIHTHAIADVTGLQSELDSKLEETAQYGNMRIGATGIELYHSPSNKWFTLIIASALGDLDTVEI